jgi:hypothetical protein
MIFYYFFGSFMTSYQIPLKLTINKYFKININVYKLMNSNNYICGSLDINHIHWSEISETECNSNLFYINTLVIFLFSYNDIYNSNDRNVYIMNGFMKHENRRL